MTILTIIGAIAIWLLVYWLARTQVKDEPTKRIIIIGITILLILLIAWQVGLLGFLYTPLGRGPRG